MDQKTQLDLYQSASNAALKSLGLKGSLAKESAKIEAFREDGFDQSNFDLWLQFYAECITRYTHLSDAKLPSASVVAATPAAQ